MSGRGSLGVAISPHCFRCWLAEHRPYERGNYLVEVRRLDCRPLAPVAGVQAEKLRRYLIENDGSGGQCRTRTCGLLLVRQAEIQSKSLLWLRLSVSSPS